MNVGRTRLRHPSPSISIRVVVAYACAWSRPGTSARRKELFIVRAFSGAIRLLCPLLTSPTLSMPVARHFVSCCQRTAVETSRGKTRHFRCASAEFTKCIPTTADGGLRGHVPARPGCTTPHIRFLFIAPQLWIQLPSDPASRQRPCRSPSLRLCENLAAGLSPT